MRHNGHSLTLANGSTVSGAVTDDTDIDLIEVKPAAVVKLLVPQQADS